LKGMAIDCETGRRHPAPVDIYVFDGAKAPEMAGLLKAIESGGPLNSPESIQRFSDRFDRVVKLLKTTKPLAHLRPDRGGSFGVWSPLLRI